MGTKATRLFIVIFLFVICFIGCNDRTMGQPPEEEDEWALSPEETVYVNAYGVWMEYPKDGNLRGNAVNQPIHNWREYTYQDILNVLQSDTITLIPTTIDDWEPFHYEAVTVIPKNDYRQAVNENSTEEVPVIVLFAYEYGTGTTYVVTGGQAYLVENSENLWQLMSPYLFGYHRDLKVHWVNRKYFIKYDIPGCEGSYYCHMFDFRYESYWSLPRELPDNFFLELPDYPEEGADDIKEALRLLSESLGYGQFAAFLGYDELTGYWEVEMDELDSAYHAYAYFDENFRILYGSTYGPIADVNGAHGEDEST